jgi:uncharacterized repeat protein (TIGR01451 family)
VNGLGPAAYYRLSDIGPPVAFDASGKGNNGAYNGSVSFLQTGAIIGDPDSAIQLNAAGQGYVISPNVGPTMGLSGANTSVTESIWFNATGAGVIVDELGQAGINQGWHDSQIEILASGDVRVRVWQTASVDLGIASFGAWHHAVLRYNQSTSTLDGFLDGVGAVPLRAQTRQIPGGNIFYALGATDGTNLGSGVYFNGQLDEFSVWGRALSDNEIESIYTAGSNRGRTFFSTGVDATRALLPDGAADPHYQITTSADPVKFPAPRAAVAANTGAPIAPSGAWVANGPSGRWIDPRPDANNGVAAGTWTYTTTFDLTGYNLANMNFVGHWAVDDNGLNIIVNGTALGVTAPGFSSLTSFTVPNALLVQGVNTIQFVTNNNGGPGGLRVDLFAIDDLPADVSVTQSANPSSVTPGGALTYTLTVTNNGPGLAPAAMVTDNLPPALTNASWTVAYSAGSNGVNNGTGNISVPVDLLPGGTATFTITGTVATNAIGSLINTATVAAGPGVNDPNPANNTSTLVTPVLAADLAVTETATTSGTLLIYKITASNLGPNLAPGVTVNATIPAGAAVISATTTQGSIIGVVNGALQASLGTMQVGQSVVVTLVVRPSTDGPIANTVTVAYVGTDPNPANNTVNLTTNYQGAVLFAVGTDAGVPAQVTVFYAATNRVKFILNPFGFFSGGVRVAMGDVNGDGTPDIICAAGPGGLPLVNIYDGTDGHLLTSFLAFSLGSANGIFSNTASALAGPIFTGGLYVAAGDVNRDGFADIIIGAGPGNSPQIEVFDGRTGSVLANFFAFSAPQFLGGVRVAAGDVNGDGRADIIVAAGRGGGPQVQVYDGATFNALFNFYCFNTPFFTGGLFVAAGDVNGDGRADIICSADGGGGPQVQLYDGRNIQPIRNFYAYPPGIVTGGVRVAARDLNNDGLADILTTTGPGSGPVVEGFSGQAPAQLSAFFAYGPGFLGGTYIG